MEHIKLQQRTTAMKTTTTTAAPATEASARRERYRPTIFCQVVSYTNTHPSHTATHCMPCSFPFFVSLRSVPRISAHVSIRIQAHSTSETFKRIEIDAQIYNVNCAEAMATFPINLYFNGFRYFCCSCCGRTRARTRVRAKKRLDARRASEGASGWQTDEHAKQTKDTSFCQSHAMFEYLECNFHVDILNYAPGCRWNVVGIRRRRWRRRRRQCRRANE